MCKKILEYFQVYFFCSFSRIQKDAAILPKIRELKQCHSPLVVEGKSTFELLIQFFFLSFVIFKNFCSSSVSLVIFEALSFIHKFSLICCQYLCYFKIDLLLLFLFINYLKKFVADTPNSVKICKSEAEKEFNALFEPERITSTFPRKRESYTHLLYEFYNRKVFNSRVCFLYNYLDQYLFTVFLVISDLNCFYNL